MYKTIFTQVETPRDISTALEMYKRNTSIADFTTKDVVIDGLGFDAEIAEIGIFEGKLVIEVRRV